MKQITIKDIEKFINDETFNSDYFNWDKGDCSLVGLIVIGNKFGGVKNVDN